MSSSSSWFSRAERVIPGGVNSPVRAFAAVGGNPPFIRRGTGAYLEDEEGRTYLDAMGSWGALILGHAPSDVVEAAVEAARSGSSFGAPTRSEVELAEALVKRVPGAEQVRLCSSGTEATMHAIRLARGYTGRDVVVKMEGCYHGAHDALLVAAGSGVATFAKPGSPGIPADVAGHTRVVPFNDADAVAELMEREGDRVAAIIVEPVPGNMGCVPPEPGYLERLRELTRAHGALLILDEVITGFRLAPGGAQEALSITADLVTMGKILGGGYPMGALAGARQVMGQLSPTGPVYQAGTLSGNPVAVAAGLATLQQLDAAAYARLEALGQSLENALGDAVAEHGWSMTRWGSMFTLFARPKPPTRFSEAQECDVKRFAALHRKALEAGVYLPPSQFEAGFINLAMGEEQVSELASVLRGALATS